MKECNLNLNGLTDPLATAEELEELERETEADVDNVEELRAAVELVEESVAGNGEDGGGGGGGGGGCRARRPHCSPPRGGEALQLRAREPGGV